MKTIIKNKFIEYNFVLFPIWIIFAYYPLKILLPFNDEFIFLIFLLVFGETHFASTYLFFFDKNNTSWIKENFIKIIIIPLILLSIYIFIGFNSLKAAIIIGAIASGIHVTRQSIGIQRIYSENRNNLFEYCTYFFSFLFLAIGFLRFYYNELIEIFNLQIFYTETTNIKLLYLLVFFIGVLLSISERDSIKKKFSNLTGVLIFSPYLFTTNIYDAAIIGVGAHWCQYLAINYKVYFSNGVFKRMQKLYLVLFLIIYSIIMSLLGFKSNFYPDLINLTLLIPLSGQFIHYYLDAFIWKFSDDHIRNNVGKRLFA